MKCCAYCDEQLAEGYGGIYCDNNNRCKQAMHRARQNDETDPRLVKLKEWSLLLARDSWSEDGARALLFAITAPLSLADELPLVTRFPLSEAA